mmetsp:Transcript_4136/g.9750  ORF Transcript_4136/g.9750 Transcript_4136/m.9750 type:complete len:280 (-) Transcript_4136:170-1009(-)
MPRGAGMQLTLAAQCHATEVPLPNQGRQLFHHPSAVAGKGLLGLLDPLLFAPAGELWIQPTCPRLGVAGIVEHLDLLRSSQEVVAVRLADAQWAERVIHVVELEVVGHIDVRPLPCVEAGEVVLLGPSTLHMLWVLRVRHLVQALLERVQTWLQQHHTRVDAGSLAPRPSSRHPAREETSSVHPLAVPVAADGAARQSCRGSQVEEIINARLHKQVRVQHQDLLVFHETQRIQLREDSGKARVRRQEKLRRCVDILYLPWYPTCLPKPLDRGSRNVAGV